MAEKPKMIKICLTNRGEDSETPWAEDLGPAPGPAGSRKVKLVNVPFLHAKPTWGDTIIVSPVEDGFLTWDRDNVWWKEVSNRIVEDGGRWAMIVDYAPRTGDAAGDKAFAALAQACEPIDVVCEGAWGPRGTEPGRAYLAVRNEVTPESVMVALRGSKLPCELIQVHPEPKKAGKQQPAKAAAKPVAKKPEPVKAAAKALAKPAAKKPAAKPITKQPAAKPVTKQPAAKPVTKQPAAKPVTKQPAPKPVAKKKPSNKSR